jgi:serine/threonine-protein kinase
VDFGIGWLAGEPTVTRDTLPPGTHEYRSPEALRFEREPANSGERYRPDEGDDVWALAVTLYWLLTDVLPFGSRHEAGLHDRILTVTPKAPHEVNARVPEALSTLCMRMLAKERSARFPGSAELCGALELALTGAELDGRWDLPLVDENALERAPTEQEPDKAPRDEEAREALQWNVARPRRGRKALRKPGPQEEKRTPPVEAPAPLLAGEPPAQVQAAEGPAPSPKALAQLLADVPPAPAGGAAPPPVPEAAGPAAQPGPAPARAEPSPALRGPKAPGAVARGLSRLLPTGVGMLPVRSVVLEAMTPMANLVVVVVAVLALAGVAAFVQSRRAPGPPPAPVPTATPTPGALLPHAWLPECPTPRACPGAELAVSPEAAEAGGGAAPVVAPTPASATAMPLRKQESRLPPPEKPAPALHPQGGRCKKWQCLAASCGWVLVACTGGPQVRATPGPEDCPAGAVKTMEEELKLPREGFADIPPGGLGQRATVRAGDAVVELVARYGGLPEGTLLTGEFILGEKLVYGRFKRAQTPQGKTYPVCLEIRDRGPGIPIRADAGPDAVKVGARVVVYRVPSFGD